MENLCHQFGLRDLVDFTTRENSKLDLVLTDVAEYDSPTKLAPIANNDHCCILLKGVQYHRSNYTKVKKRIVTPERKKDLLTDLASISWDAVLNATNVNDKVLIFHQIITTLLNKHCPEKTVKVRSDRPPWMTNSILKLIRARDEAHSRGCLSYKLLRSPVQRAIRSSKRRYIDEKLNSEQDTKSWWETVKQITNNQTKPKVPEYAVINVERQDNKQLCENLNNYYQSVGGEAVQQSGDVKRGRRVPLDQLSLGEVKHLINMLDTSKATSQEDFPTWLSKEGKEDVCVPFQDIINCMLVSGKFPDFYKRDQISPYLKYLSLKFTRILDLFLCFFT